MATEETRDAEAYVKELLASGSVKEIKVEGPVKFSDPNDTSSDGEWSRRRDGDDLVDERMEGDVETEHFRLTDSAATDEVHLGQDMSISAAGHHVRVVSDGLPGNDAALVLQIPYNDSGTAEPITPILSTDEPELLQPDDSNDRTLTVLGSTLNVPEGRLIRNIYLKSGSVAASEWVVFRVFYGSDNTGELLYQEKIRADAWIANSDIAIETNDKLGTPKDTDFYFEISSSASFGILCNAAGDLPYYSIDRFIGSHDNLAHSNAWVDGTDYAVDAMILEEGIPYICTTPGVQTGSFAGFRSMWSRLYRRPHNVCQRLVAGDYDDFNIRVGGLMFRCAEPTLSDTNYPQVKLDSDGPLIPGHINIQPARVTNSETVHLSTSNTKTASQLVDWQNMGSAVDESYMRLEISIHCVTVGQGWMWKVIYMVDGNGGCTISVDFRGGLDG